MVRQPRYLAALIALAACGSSADKDEKRDPPRAEKKAVDPAVRAKAEVADKLGQHRAAYAYLQDTYKQRHYRDGERKELLDYLAEGYRKDRGRDGTLDEQLAWLEEVYAGSKAPARFDGPDPSARYAVDITNAVAAGQVEGPADAPVTIALAFDYG